MRGPAKVPEERSAPEEKSKPITAWPLRLEGTERARPQVSRRPQAAPGYVSLWSWAPQAQREWLPGLCPWQGPAAGCSKSWGL